MRPSSEKEPCIVCGKFTTNRWSMCLHPCSQKQCAWANCEMTVNKNLGLRYCSKHRQEMRRRERRAG